jgi:hypothetical protein
MGQLHGGISTGLLTHRDFDQFGLGQGRQQEQRQRKKAGFRMCHGAFPSEKRST